MTQISVLALLWAARNLFARIPSWRLIAADRRVANELADAIEHMLLENVVVAVTDDLLRAVRAQWRDHAEVQIDETPLARRGIGGLWVSAWVLAGSEKAELDGDKFQEAMACLPLMAREVYRLHRIENRNLEETGRTLGLSSAEVEAQLADALRGLHRHLYPQR